MQIKKIYIGGWFQRTTLHLSEIFDFIKYGKSELKFPKKKLDEARKILQIKKISREIGPLEYISVKTKKEIDFRIYEDGLMILEKNYQSLKDDLKIIKDYYDNRLAKSISFIFSRGAPVPKELADIKTILPYIITVVETNQDEIKNFFADFKQDIYSTISSKQIEVYRSAKFILINNLQDESLTREIIESQIFFREFKSQLHRYLTIHRIIWEKIEKIKEQGQVKGSQIEELRNKLSGYQKTIGLIEARIEQMGSYVETRKKITDQEKIDNYLRPLFQFKFETLLDTLDYIKNLWDMTKNYLDSVIQLVSELEAESTKTTISSLQLVTAMGVMAGILRYLDSKNFPSISAVGFLYLALLIAATWGVNSLVTYVYKNKKYKLEWQRIGKKIN